MIVWLFFYKKYEGKKIVLNGEVYSYNLVLFLHKFGLAKDEIIVKDTLGRKKIVKKGIRIVIEFKMVNNESLKSYFNG